MKLYSDASGEFSRDFRAMGPSGEDDADLHVFDRRDGAIRHFWSGEMDLSTADPGRDPRGAPDLMPLWTVLDSTPEGEVRIGIRSSNTSDEQVSRANGIAGSTTDRNKHQMVREKQ